MIASIFISASFILATFAALKNSINHTKRAGSFVFIPVSKKTGKRRVF